MPTATKTPFDSEQELSTVSQAKEASVAAVSVPWWTVAEVGLFVLTAGALLFSIGYGWWKGH